MDEWTIEMNEIRHRLHELRVARGDPVIIDELEAQLRILRSFYETAWRVFEEGETDPTVRADFAATNLGEWTYQNVYTFIYETAMTLPPGRRELSSLVPEIDYLALIREGAH